MKIKYTAVSGLLAVSLGLSQPIWANDWYIGLGLGNSDTDLELSTNDLEELVGTISPGTNVTSNIDSSGDGVKLFIGKSINENLAFEGGYLDLGDVVDISATFTGTDPFFGPFDQTVDASISVDGIYFAGIGKLPLTDLVTLNARAGLYIWELDVGLSFTDNLTNANLSGSDDDSGNDTFFGVGVNIGWFGIQYEVYDINGDDVDYIGITGHYNF